MKWWTVCLTDVCLNTVFSGSVSTECNALTDDPSFTKYTADWFSQAEFDLPFYFCFILWRDCRFIKWVSSFICMLLPPPLFLPEQFSNVDSSKDVHFCLTLSNISNLPHMFLMSCLMASAFWFCPTINGYNKHHFKHLSWVDVQDIYTHPF